MDTATLLRQTVADFFDVDAAQVGPGFSLQSRQGSIARAALDAAIRGRVGVKSQAVYRARTFADLEAEFATGAAGMASPPTLAESASAQAPEPVLMTATSGTSCGVDIELVANLPEAADPWEDTFYRAHFTPGEIAYCLRQAEPAPHFAARWCAKEALKKADRAFLTVDPKAIEVVRDEAGAPWLEYLDGGRSRRLPHAVSLSHTTHSAVAVVVRADPSPIPIPPAPIAVAAPMPAPVASTPPSRGRGGKVLLLANLLALALAVLALARTFPGFRWPWAG